MSNSSPGGGIGVAGLLGVAFIILKLTGVIAWSWLWVLAPFWIPTVLVILFLAVLLVVAVFGKPKTKPNTWEWGKRR